MPRLPDPPRLPRSVSAKDVDLHSKEALRWSTFDFPPYEQVQVPIAIFHCINPLGLCVAMKEWFFNQFHSGIYGTPDHLRIECQGIDELKRDVQGKMILIEGAATLSSSSSSNTRKDSGVGVSRKASGIPIGIMGLFVSKDGKVRWFYSAVPFKMILLHLHDTLEFITLQKTLEPGSHHHKRLYTFSSQAFSTAIAIPEAPDYLNAISLTDYAPSIRDDPDNNTTALDRLLNMESIQHKEWMDLSQDRYLLELEPAEREIASLVQLRCAEYLLVKRNFFKEFFTDVYRSDEAKKRKKKVRTDHAHQVWLEEALHWKSTRAKRLVAAWKELGMLDEKRFLPWIREGGMLTETEFWSDGEEDLKSQRAGSEEEQ